MSDYNYVNCETCITYAEGRITVLPQAIVDDEAKTGESSQEVLDRYMTGVHERHLSGLSLDVTAREEAGK